MTPATITLAGLTFTLPAGYVPQTSDASSFQAGNPSGDVLYLSLQPSGLPRLALDLLRSRRELFLRALMTQAPNLLKQTIDTQSGGGTVVAPLKVRIVSLPVGQAILVTTDLTARAVTRHLAIWILPSRSLEQLYHLTFFSVGELDFARLAPTLDSLHLQD
jgi:hypothetical protein